MKLNIFCCLLACVLGCNATADFIHKVVMQTNTVNLPCRRSVEGSVTWSRENNGSKVELITVSGRGEKRHNDPGKRYGSLADEFKSLHIVRASVSDSGRYFCDNEPAADLTVIPSGTTIVNVTEGTNVTLNCNCTHHVGRSGVPMWSRQIAGKQQQIRPQVSPPGVTLFITHVEAADSGLYYCDGKTAAYLDVNKERMTTTTETSTTTSKPTASMTTLKSTSVLPKVPSGNPPHLDLQLGMGALVLLIIIIIVFVIFFTWRRRLKRRESNERYHVYETPAKEELRPANDLQNSAAGNECIYYMVDFPGGPNQNDPTYSTIPDLPNTGSNIESPYSLIGATFHNGNKVNHS